MRLLLRTACPSVLIGVLFATSLRADEAARVDGVTIETAQVAALLHESFGQREIDPQALPALQAQALAQLVDRQLVLGYLASQKSVVSAEQVDAALARFKKQLELRKLSFEDFLKADKLTEPLLRRKIVWQHSWQAHTARTLTEERLRAFFERNRRELDGSQVRVSHLLLKPAADAGADEIAKLERHASRLRDQIRLGSLSFADAVQQYSAGTRKNGGDLGFIPRHGTMPEPFSRAAFQLEKNQLSEPIETPFGVHLILCMDVKTGEKSFEQVLDEVRRQAAIELFRRIADAQRSVAEIQYTGKAPYLDPRTKKLVVPAAAD